MPNYTLLPDPNLLRLVCRETDASFKAYWLQFYLFAPMVGEIRLIHAHCGSINACSVCVASEQALYSTNSCGVGQVRLHRCEQASEKVV